MSEKNGAGTKSRTRDLLITNQLLYQLSYTGTEQTLQLATPYKDQAKKLASA